MLNFIDFLGIYYCITRFYSIERGAVKRAQTNSKIDERYFLTLDFQQIFSCLDPWPQKVIRC
jgi:hypothetical protein